MILKICMRVKFSCFESYAERIKELRIVNIGSWDIDCAECCKPHLKTRVFQLQRNFEASMLALTADIIMRGIGEFIECQKTSNKNRQK